MQYFSNLSCSLHCKIQAETVFSMRSLCVFWYWVMEHAEDISTLPKTTIKLRDSVSHFPYRQIQLFSNAWKITRVSSHNS